MFAMVGDVPTRAGVGEDGESIAVERHPLRELAELLRLDGELAASAWVRTDGFLVKAADEDAETGTSLLREPSGTVDLVGIEIDMGVEIADRAHCAHLAEPGFLWEKSRL